MARRRARWIPSALVAGLLAFAAPSAAAPPEAMVLPLRPRAMLEVGGGWDSETGQARGEQGACVEIARRESREGGAPSWSLLVLSRVGGRLLLGVHVSAPVSVEGVVEARFTDAARRLVRTDPEGFRALCGDGFVAAVTSGDQYVAEIEVDPRDAARASARLVTGTWPRVEPFREALEAVVGSFRTSARELPGGRRAAATDVDAAQVLERAAVFTETVTPGTGRPYLALYRSYPDDAAFGLPIELDPSEGWSDVAARVFLDDRTRGATSAPAAARAAEMRRALVRRERPREAPAAARDPALAAPPWPAAAAPEAAPTASGPSDLPGTAVAPAAKAPSEPARVRKVAALVYDDPGGTPVFATTEPPPGVHAERVKKHALWVPGAAEATPALREALARAAAGTPSRGTTLVLGEGGARGVVMTDVPPIPGVHQEAAGALHAWIAGVAEPTPAEREAIAAAVRAEAGR